VSIYGRQRPSISHNHHQFKATQSTPNVKRPSSYSFLYLYKPSLFSSIRHFPNMLPLFLTTRGILNHDENDKSSKHVCPTEDTTGPTIVPFIGSLTYHQFSTILSGSCAALSTLIICVLIATHAFNYSNPVQQRQIIRITLLVPYVSFFSFLIVWRDNAGGYLVESLDFGCAIALSAFLLFMCDLVLSHPGGFEDLFRQAKGASRKSSPASLRVRYHIPFILMALIIGHSACGMVYCNGSQLLLSSGSQPPSHSQSEHTAKPPTAYTSPTSG
jgi:hypothetical protein